MNKQEALIVSAYTGILMTDFSSLHEYIETLLDRPVFSHELADPGVQEAITAKVKPHFLELCANLDEDY